jgi:hypothetical protein
LKHQHAHYYYEEKSISSFIQELHPSTANRTDGLTVRTCAIYITSPQKLIGDNESTRESNQRKKGTTGIILTVINQYCTTVQIFCLDFLISSSSKLAPRRTVEMRKPKDKNRNLIYICTRKKKKESQQGKEISEMGRKTTKNLTGID